MKTVIAVTALSILTGCAQTPLGRLNALNNQYNTKCTTTTFSGGYKSSMYDVCRQPNGDINVNKVY